MARRKLADNEAIALSTFMEINADVLLSMLLDHGLECSLHKSARALLALAEWDEAKLAAVIVDRSFL